MRRPGLLAMISAIGLLTLSGASSSGEVPPITPSKPLWVVGDSIGVGIAAALRRAGERITDMAVESTNARQWVVELAKGQWPSEPATIVVSLGTNDAASAVLLREFRANAETIMRALLARGHQVIWILPPSPACRIPQGSDVEFFMNLGGHWVLDRSIELSDKWHPTAAGYDRLAASVRAIRKGQ